MSTCVRGEGGLWRVYRRAEAEDKQAILYADRVEVFQHSLGTLGQLLGQGQWQEAGHMFQPSSGRTDICGLCGGQKGASLPDEALADE